MGGIVTLSVHFGDPPAQRACAALRLALTHFAGKGRSRCRQRTPFSPSSNAAGGNPEAHCSK